MAENKRETGATKLKPAEGPDPSDDFSQDAAANKKPDGIGNSEPVDDVDAKTRHSEGVQPRGAVRP